MLNPRRTLLKTIAGFAIGALRLPGQEPSSDPWPPQRLLEPSALAKILQSSAIKPAIICVAFPVLYRQRHILGAAFAGPTSKPEGIAALKEAAAKLPKDSAIVIYCGCCPMVKCPNIRPAYRGFADLGYNHVQVLNLPTNFHTDWSEKGYPVEV